MGVFGPCSHVLGVRGFAGWRVLWVGAFGVRGRAVRDPSATVGEALAAVEEAHAYGYDGAAAFSAAYNHLMDADRETAVQVAALIASWLAHDLNPSQGRDLGAWVELMTAEIAKRVRRS